ncbi:MAG: manganese efflux pump [Methanosphaera sp.]|nr:manganese efflux pump [Methanosphaera sp.]
MDFISVFLIAVALAMDSFSVSLTKGFTQKNLQTRQIVYYGLFFGLFHLFVPIIGYYAGVTVTHFVTKIAPWVAFILLFIVGANMIKESLENEDEEITDEFSFKELFLLAIATSIDAFAIGVTFALLNTNIFIPAIITSLVVFTLSIVGILIGKRLGDYFGDKFLILGGVILILIGIKILLGS